MQKKYPSPLVPYEKFMTIEKIGSFPLHLEALKDLDRSLDEICKKYEPKTPAEEEALLNLCPYFGVIWPSARALATFMSERKNLFTKKRGIEVGCGLGLPAILAAKIGASIQASDFHPDVEAWVKRNAELNQVNLEYVEWDWTHLNQIPAAILPRSYDFVLASDVLYERRHVEDIARALANLVKPKGSIYLSDPGRVYLDLALAEFEKLGFHRVDFNFEVEESSSRPEIRLEKTRGIQVFEFIRE
jgi:predicted nicotinamide N-methyase